MLHIAAQNISQRDDIGSREFIEAIPLSIMCVYAWGMCPSGAVFTERGEQCSLLDHTKQYSPYGVGFKKARLFAAGGGPAIYLRPHLHENQHDFKSEHKPEWRGFHPELYAFITPFCPAYAPKTYMEKHWAKKAFVDYSHEREWRVPHDFSFELSQVEFVIVPDYETVAKFPKSLKDAIGREKFIMLEVYSQIEKLWPAHLL